MASDYYIGQHSLGNLQFQEPENVLSESFAGKYDMRMNQTFEHKNSLHLCRALWGKVERNMDKFSEVVPAFLFNEWW